MNDWLNYEGSGSSLSHGYDLGYDYDYGVTRHGSVLVHAERVPQGPRRPVRGWAGKQGLLEPVKEIKQDPIKSWVTRNAWKQKGKKDAEAVFQKAAAMFRKGQYPDVIKYIDTIRSEINGILANKRYTGVGPNSNTRIPGQYMMTYAQAFNESHNLLDTTYDRAQEKNRKELSSFGIPNRLRKR